MKGMEAKLRWSIQFCPGTDDSAQTAASRSKQKLYSSEKLGGCALKRLEVAGSIVTIVHQLDRATSCDVTYSAEYVKGESRTAHLHLSACCTATLIDSAACIQRMCR